VEKGIEEGKRSALRLDRRTSDLKEKGRAQVSRMENEYKGEMERSESLKE